MAVPITQILRREITRILNEFGAAPGDEKQIARDSEIETIIRNGAATRLAADELIRRYEAALSENELIEIQSEIYARLDELLALQLTILFEQRSLALTERAEFDPVTKLPNRAAFNRKLQDEIARARRYRRDLSLVLFDVDRFKSVNDQLGHPAGDRVLSQVARILKASMRQSDTVFRYGGDEFAAICPETPGDAMACALRRLESNLLDLRIESCLPEHLNISSGVASFPADGAGEDELISVADQRLYACKEAHHRATAGHNRPARI